MRSLLKGRGRSPSADACQDVRVNEGPKRKRRAPASFLFFLPPPRHPLSHARDALYRRRSSGGHGHPRCSSIPESRAESAAGQGKRSRCERRDLPTPALMRATSHPLLLSPAPPPPPLRAFRQPGLGPTPPARRRGGDWHSSPRPRASGKRPAACPSPPGHHPALGRHPAPPGRRRGRFGRRGCGRRRPGHRRRTLLGARYEREKRQKRGGVRASETVHSTLFLPSHRLSHPSLPLSFSLSPPKTPTTAGSAPSRWRGAGSPGSWTPLRWARSSWKASERRQTAAKMSLLLPQARLSAP